MIRHLWIALFLLPSLSGVTLAGEATGKLQSELNAFMQSPQYNYAPATAARAQALLGAALMAEDKQDSEQLQSAIKEAGKALDEARNNARLFEKQFTDLIDLRRAANEAIPYARQEAPTSTTDPKRLIREAEESFKATVSAAENGDLGQAQQQAATAKQRYTHVIDKCLPAIIDQAGETISRAAASGAKRYAPVTYEHAKQAMDGLQRYLDGVVSETPVHPARAILLAEQARDMAKQVKSWRRDTGSHEALVLQARKERLRLAGILGMKIDDPELDDISIDQLATRSADIMRELKEQQQRNADMKQQMTAEFEQRLQQKLAEVKNEIQTEKDQQLSNMKEAFRAKLERETFETKRQKQLQKLFKPDEAVILANLDGSLLLRLSSLKFSSGSSKINQRYFDLLGRVKEGLALYGDRKVRIEGHTDNRGDVKLNQQLSLKRAEAVRDFLIAAGTPGRQLKALGYGEVKPIASNEFEKGRAMNRRIDIIIEASHD